MGDAATFSREGFGRQSMSEKRKGHIDPNQSEVYQKIKTIRDSNRGNYLWHIYINAKIHFCLMRASKD